MSNRGGRGDRGNRNNKSSRKSQSFTSRKEKNRERRRARRTNSNRRDRESEKNLTTSYKKSPNKKNAKAIMFNFIAEKIKSSNDELTRQGVEEFNQMSFRPSKHDKFINLAIGYECILAMSDDDIASIFNLYDRGIFSRLYVLCYGDAKKTSSFRRRVRKSKIKSRILPYVLYSLTTSSSGMETNSEFLCRTIAGFNINRYVDSNKESVHDVIQCADLYLALDNLPVFFWNDAEENLKMFKRFISKYSKSFIALFEKSKDANHIIDTDAIVCSTADKLNADYFGEHYSGAHMGGA